MRRVESDRLSMRYVVNRDESVQNVLEGVVYYAYSSRGDADPLPDEQSIDIVVTSPEDMSIGIGFVARIGGDAELKVYEDVSDVTGGTVFVPRNRNKQSNKTSLSGVIVQPTAVTTNGVLYEEIIIGGTSGSAAGATLEGDYAVIKADTSYLFRLTNRSNQARIAELLIKWVET